MQICIGTIIDVHKSLPSPPDDGEFLSQFEKLKETINNIDMSKVCEGDVLLVEQATNELLGEFRPVFETGECGLVYQEVTH